MRDEARAQVAVEIDPSEVKREKAALIKQKHANTFESVAENYLNKIRIEGRAEATLKKVAFFLAMANADFGQKPIAELSAAAILKTLKKVEVKGHYETAKRLRSTVGAVFRYAIANGLADNDPTYPLRDALIRHKVISRAAITDKVALGGLMRAIDGYEGQVTTRIGLELLAIMATRPGELRGAEWAEFDIDFSKVFARNHGTHS